MVRVVPVGSVNVTVIVWKGESVAEVVKLNTTGAPMSETAGVARANDASNGECFTTGGGLGKTICARAKAGAKQSSSNRTRRFIGGGCEIGG